MRQCAPEGRARRSGEQKIRASQRDALFRGYASCWLEAEPQAKLRLERDADRAGPAEAAAEEASRLAYQFLRRGIRARRDAEGRAVTCAGDHGVVAERADTGAVARAADERVAEVHTVEDVEQVGDDFEPELLAELDRVFHADVGLVVRVAAQ